MYVGMTEAGDAGIDFSWLEKVNRRAACAGAILITKNSGSEVFQEKVRQLEKPCIIHCGITGWGGTRMEPFIKKPLEVVQSLRNFIDRGFPADRLVLRIDPIFPNEEGLRRATYVMQLRDKYLPDIKRVRLSICDPYKHTNEELVQRGYEPVQGTSNRRPTAEQVRMVAEAMMGVSATQQYELCAEPELAKAYPDRFTWSGCLSQIDCDIMGIPVPEGTGINGQHRYGCRCLMMKSELLSNKVMCPHKCAYCYWGQKGKCQSANK